MAELALLSLVASLSMLTSAWLSLDGLPEQKPIAIAAAASALIFAALYAITRRRENASVEQLKECVGRPAADTSSDGGNLIAAG
ncbi:MAG TPA: hypothetical protein VHC19_25000 [Pirellulales bacterium]|nr:hypothetical protein [Pirellulales bacterium]